VRIGEDGRVCSAKVIDTNVSADFTSCVLDAFKRGSYPAPSGGCVDATIPLSFVRQSSPAGDSGAPTSP
jgi:hypothetical protein